MYRKNNIWEEKKIIGSLASYLGILDDEFEELLSTGKIIVVIPSDYSS